MYNYNYLTRVINIATAEVYEQWHYCARPQTALRRVVRKFLPLVRWEDTDVFRVAVLDKEGNVLFEGYYM